MIDFYHFVHFYNDLSSKHSANSLELLSQNILSLRLEEKGKLSVVVKQVPYYRQIPVLDIYIFDVDRRQQINTHILLPAVS